MTASTKQNLVTKLLLTFYLLASVLTINGKAIEEKLPGYIENIEKGSSDKVRGIPTQIYQRYMIDFP